MSGSGNLPVGDGNAGVVPTNVAAASAKNYPVALRYDGASKDFPLDASGQYLSVHPVDQRVALKLCVRAGSIKSVPALGSKFHLIKLDRRAGASVRDEVFRVLAEEIASGSVRVVGVESAVDMALGRLFVRVNYLNLRSTNPNDLRTATNGPPIEKST